MLNAQKSLVDKEFVFTQQNFDQVVKLINDLSGICLTERKVDMVYSRLARRIRLHGLNDFDSYLAFVSDNQEEQVNFINSLTTNLTHFFRENHHFEYLKNTYFPEMFKNNQRKIRFWSAGCSTGEEPYTLAMLWHKLQDKPKYADFKILATDLDTNVLDSCRQGIYSDDKLKPVGSEYRGFFKHTSVCKPDEKQINPKLQEIIFFKQLNLMDEWPISGPLDLVICRNVLIYFDKPTQKRLVERFTELIRPGGCLMLGHSENLSADKAALKAIGKTIYRKE
ncbi:MAG: protein-glutamate O-methyltransferase CheR [Gammaproteobacteria bacterium]|nr:protein-glutamate O-methyltransferase CheR [Gammaproteobacteria bacterium]